MTPKKTQQLTRAFLLIALIALGFSCSAGPRFAVWELGSSSRFIEKNNHFEIQNTTCKSTPIGFIFYPGGLVNPAAYIPLAAALAKDCHKVLIAKMPFDLAVLNSDIANHLQTQYASQAQQWLMGGHSLGGAMAAKVVKSNPAGYQGLILLAAYPAESDSLANVNVPVLSISGSNDGLATPAKIEATKGYLPDSTTYIEIAGGNHAQFGDYGPQANDGVATISGQTQLQETYQAIADFIEDRVSKSSQNQ
jgi:pimeloyl-ACP methyl ester carboxylesterase